MTASPRLAPTRPDLVWFTGADTVRFLNDLISQEIGDMPVGAVRRSLLLTPRGKLDHFLWVLKGVDVVGLVTDQGRGEELAATMGRYRIRVDVVIEPETRPLWVLLGGDPVGGWSGRRDDSLHADVSWRVMPRVLVAGERPDLPEATMDDHELARVSSGEPRWGVDIDDGTIPQETGLTGVTVDFDKGCFLGQELVGRIEHRGHVNRHLRLLEASGPITPGAVISVDGKPVGVVSSVAGSLGLGLVRREVSPGDRALVDGVTSVVRDVPEPSSATSGG